MRKTKKPVRMKVTDIETIYSRPYDFKDHSCIFDYQNEYSNTLNSAHILYNFQNIEAWVDEAKNSHKPYKKITPEREQAERQHVKIKRQIVNTGLDHVECVEENQVSADFLFCNEELPLSVACEDDYLDGTLEADPYADSDDSCKDKNYVPEESLGSQHSDETVIVDNHVYLPLKSISKEMNSSQHCEYEQCKLPALGCCEKCFCLLCSVHFDKIPMICQKHYPPYSNDSQKRHPHITDKQENKENDRNANNCSLSTEKILSNEKKNETIMVNEYRTTCDYVNCKIETFSACKYCQCYLCYSHFIDDDTYIDCKNHTNPYLAPKTNTEKITIIQNIKINSSKNYTKTKPVVNQKKDKNTEKGKKEEEIVHIKKDNKEIENPKECIKDTQKRRKSFGGSDSAQISTTRKRRHTIDVHLSEPSELLRKRKKYDSSLLQRTNDAKTTRILEHSVKPGCGEKCLKTCNTIYSQEDRAAINTKFWNMSWQEQHAFVRAHTSVAIPKRKSTTEPKRKPRRAFSLKKIDGTRVEVCKTFFLTTLGYEKNNDRILNNNFTDQSTDNRGKHQKTPAFDRDTLTQHIESFHPLAHHYRREHAPLRRYLPSDLNITQMHKHFCEINPEKTVSYEFYRHHVRKMNISFTCLGNEECEACESYNFHAKNTLHDARKQIDEDCTICADWAGHHRKYKAARELYNEHKEAVQSDSQKYYSADLEKVIMLPRLDMFKAAIFCSRLVLFNETFAPVGKITTKSKPLTAIWHQAIAGRKQNDIISAFYHFLFHNRDVSTLHIWLDNCSAQNKNWLLYSFFAYMVNSNIIGTEKIVLYYFEPGHTFMSCDQVHHQIELAMKKKGKLYDFTDFEEAVASINKSKVIVKSMATEDFLDIQSYISDRRIQNSNPRAYLKDMVQVCFIRDSYDLMYKNDFKDEYSELRFLNDKYLKNPSIMKLEFRSKPKGVESKRKAEIIRNLLNIIPKHKQQFWINLPAINFDGNEKGTSDAKNKRRNCRD